MKYAALFTAFVLMFSLTLVFAQGPGPGGQQRAFPREVPDEIVEEGMVPEFIELMCGVLKHNILRFTDGFQAVIDHFKALDEDPDVGPYLTLDLTPIQGLKDRVMSTVDGICTATEANIEDRLGEMADFIEGSDGIQTEMEALGESLRTQLETALGGQGGDQQAGEQLRAQIEQAAGELQALQAQIQAEQQKTPPDQNVLASLQQQITAKQAELEQLQAQAGQAQQQGNETMAKMQRIQQRLQQFQADMEAAAKQKFEQTDYSEQEKFMFEKQKEFFLKIFTKKMAQGKKDRDALAAAGVDVSALDAFFSKIQAYVDQNTQGAGDVFASGDEAKVQAFFAGLEALGEQAETDLAPIMEKNTKDVFFPKADEVEKIIKDGVKKAKAAGIDTSTIEALAAQLETHVDAAKDAFDTRDLQTGLTHIEQARTLFEQIKQEWEKLEAAYNAKVGGAA